MSTVTPRRAETLEESSARRLLFWLERGELVVGREEGEDGGGCLLFSVVSFGHGGNWWMVVRGEGRVCLVVSE